MYKVVVGNWTISRSYRRRLVSYKGHIVTSDIDEDWLPVAHHCRGIKETGDRARDEELCTPGAF